jgi:SAM-dependent MidA family methyltransferase
MQLSECIAERIRRDGPVRFRDFMEMCLYDTELGYYTTKCKGIGKNGDFYTSATLTPVFGTLLGKQLEEMWELMDCPDFTIVEYGAGTGHLCRDILAYLEGNTKMYTGLRYCVIEKSPLMREQAGKQLPGKIEWYNSISEIQDMTGCVLSNELVDNFAVHRVVMEKELMEVYVDYQDGFTEQLHPAGPELETYLSELDIRLPVGYATEINLEALDWISEVASALRSGFVLTIDYGHKSPGMYKMSRSQGTLLCYYKHSVNDSFYEHIGEQDITSHVNFSALSLWGAKNGLRESGFTDQGYFLTSLGFREQLLKALSGEHDVLLAAQKAASLSHTLLIDMGSKYKVLVQEKDVKSNKVLSGLVICRTI